MITVGSRVGGYTVLQELGQGGMGRVYLAQHHRIERRAAVKVLLPELSTNAGVVERFFTEARATSSIRHPGIVEVLDCDVADGNAFIIMEYLEGESLAIYLRRILGLASDRTFALAVVAQVAQAVAAAHARGIIHRDLKPDNVFLCGSGSDPHVVTKVLDFGIAKLAQQHDAAHTRSGAIMGTPAYMSPEQCRGGNRIVDARSDVYSLGCILYETLCGRRPFVRDGLGDMILAHVSEAPEPLHVLVPELPPAIDALAMRMLAKNPAARPQSMDDVAAEIIECLKGLGVQTALGDIRPIEPLVVQVRGQVPAGARDSQATPPTPGSGSDAGGRVMHPGTQIGSGGTRLMSPGDGATEFDLSALAPIPTTFQETVGESMRRTVASPRFRTVMLLAVAVIAGGGTVAALMSRGPARVSDPAEDTTATISAAAGEARGAPTGGGSRALERIVIDVRGAPPNVQISLDGSLAGGLPLHLARDDRRHVLALHANGYEDRTIEIDAQHDQVVDVAMNPLAAAAKAATEGRDVSRGYARRRSQKRSDGKSDGRGDGKSSDPTDNVDAITDI